LTTVPANARIRAAVLNLPFGPLAFTSVIRTFLRQ
jgi:hypothetical protein